MTKEEVENGSDEMLIDGPDQGNASPGGFNPNYLKVYYGKFFCNLASILFLFLFWCNLYL